MAKKKPMTKKTGRGPLSKGYKRIGTLQNYGTRGDWIGRTAWSPDGELLAFGTEAGFVEVWKLAARSLSHLLKHQMSIPAVAWSSDGLLLAGSGSRGIPIWSTKTWGKLRTLSYKGADTFYTVAWAPGRHVLATGSSDQAVTLWDGDTGQPIRTLTGHAARVLCVAWSPDGSMLASCGDDDWTRIWDPATGRMFNALMSGPARFIAWTPDGRRIAVASRDRIIKIWDVKTGLQPVQMEGHTGPVHSVSFSADGRLLASKAEDETVRIWRCDTWEPVAIIPERTSDKWPPIANFNPTNSVLSTSSDLPAEIHLWQLDRSLIDLRESSSAHYSNAKVVLVGNTGVGKSGLGFVLANKRYRITDSTHSRHVWTLDSEPVLLDGNLVGDRETMLWDLAGQPGYRLIHQLHLNEVAVALVLFDSRSETDPFSGVPYWAQALDQATQGFPLKKFLVASRSDRGGPKVSRERINDLVRRYGFDGYFETSAKRGYGIQELREAIRQAIQWDKLPKVSTTELFVAAKQFLVAQKTEGLVIARQSELFERFSRSKMGVGASEDVFATCMMGLESAGLVKRLSFGRHVLLQPEVLDAYCGWMATAAREQPDGLGFIKEDDARNGNFGMDEDRALKDKPEEKIMLVAMTYEVITRNIAHRQETSRGTMLVFPSELNAELPDYPGGYSLAVAFLFRGPVSGIYATLAVTLLNSVVFEKKQLFKNAALFVGPRKQICGFAIEYPDKSDDALGRLTVFFEKETATEVRLLFLRFVNQQLQRLALENSVGRERIYHCADCNYTISREVVTRRIDRGETTVPCSICLRQYPLNELLEEIEVPDTQLATIDARAVEERERQARLTVLDERKRANEFHLFLCHNSKDKPEVRELAKVLLEHGVLSWVDENGILAGDRFAPKLEETIDRARVVAVVIGPSKLGRWQALEYQAALQRSVEERDEGGRPRVRLIPVLLPGASNLPEDLPAFLRGANAIDLRKKGVEDADEVRRLVQAIFHENSPY